MSGWVREMAMERGSRPRALLRPRRECSDDRVDRYWRVCIVFKLLWKVQWGD